MPTIRPSCLLVAALLAGCATPSDHHATNYRGGYSEAQIGSASFRVTYQGNITQRQAETDELALLRSAEVAQEHGYGWFMSSGNAATGSALALFSGAVSVPATTITIACFPTRPDTSALVYESDRVIATLGPKYRRL